ncbi:MAG TPA: zinc-binding dehydrogenase [Acetobacteraceae bacterium]|nr:zinc-binding dehydrogenase [Acetobacteraceae bacterium]
MPKSHLCVLEMRGAPTPALCVFAAAPPHHLNAPPISQVTLNIGGAIVLVAGFNIRGDTWVKSLSANEALLQMVREGRLNTLVERTYPPAQTGEAMRVIEDYEVFGKFVVTP